MLNHFFIFGNRRKTKVVYFENFEVMRWTPLFSSLFDDDDNDDDDNDDDVSIMGLRNPYNPPV